MNIYLKNHELIKPTHDHQKIKKWAEEQDGVPSKIKDTGKDGEEGVLRIHFPDHSDNDDRFEEVS